MTPELTSWSRIIDGMEINSAQEREFYGCLSAFLQTLDPDLLPQLHRAYQSIDDLDESYRAFGFCQMVSRSLPDVIVKETFVRITQH